MNVALQLYAIFNDFSTIVATYVLRVVFKIYDLCDRVYFALPLKNLVIHGEGSSFRNIRG